MKSVSWVSRAGKKIEIVIDCRIEEDVHHSDLLGVVHTGRFDIYTNIVAYHDGVKIGDSYIDGVQMITPTNGIVATICGKIALDQNHCDLVKNAISEEKNRAADSSEEYKNYLAKCERGLKIEQEYEKHYNAVKNMMTLNGTSF